MRLKRVPTAFLRPLPPLILIKRPEAAFFYAFYVQRPSENLFFIKKQTFPPQFPLFSHPKIYLLKSDVCTNRTFQFEQNGKSSLNIRNALYT